MNGSAPHPAAKHERETTAAVICDVWGVEGIARIAIADATAFGAVVDDILTNNPFGCTPYESGGQAMPAVEKTRESYTARFVYENGEAVAIGTTAVRCPTVAAYTGVVTAVPAATAISTAIGEPGVHVLDDDSFSATVRCHDASGELYNVAVTRTAVTVSGYEADAILAAVEAWADTVPALA